MCKAVDRGMRPAGICPLDNKGGKSGHWIRDLAPHPAAVITGSAAVN